MRSVFQAWVGESGGRKDIGIMDVLEGRKNGCVDLIRLFWVGVRVVRGLLVGSDAAG